MSCGTLEFHAASSVFVYGGITLCALPFQAIRLTVKVHYVAPKPQGQAPGLAMVPVRSPLLGESLLISFPPGTEMVHFPGFAYMTYVFSHAYQAYAWWVTPFGNPWVNVC